MDPERELEWGMMRTNDNRQENDGQNEVGLKLREIACTDPVLLQLASSPSPNLPLVLTACTRLCVLPGTLRVGLGLFIIVSSRASALFLCVGPSGALDTTCAGAEMEAGAAGPSLISLAFLCFLFMLISGTAVRIC